MAANNDNTGAGGGGGGGEKQNPLEMYEVVQVIGKGSFGTVSKIRRRADGRLMVWKELNYGSMREKEKQLVVSEVNILRELKHPFIVRYYDRIIDKAATRLYIVMEFCEGGDLGAMIKKARKEGGAVDEEFIWKVFAQILVALKECHRHKDAQGKAKPILHRDLKPGNIFLDSQSNIKIGDFGLAKELASESKFAYTNVGTPFYMSPEMINELKYNEKSDIWALGCLLYELASLVPPFEATNHLSLAVKINAGKFNRVPIRYSEDLHRAIRWMLQVDSTKRPTVEELEKLPRLKPGLDKATAYLRDLQRAKEAAAAAAAGGRTVSSTTTTASSGSSSPKEEEIARREVDVSRREAEVARREAAVSEWERGLRERESALATRMSLGGGGGISSRPSTASSTTSTTSTTASAFGLPQAGGNNNNGHHVNMNGPSLHRAHSTNDLLPGQQMGGARRALSSGGVPTVTVNIANTMMNGGGGEYNTHYQANNNGLQRMSSTTGNTTATTTGGSAHMVINLASNNEAGGNNNNNNLDANNNDNNNGSSSSGAMDADPLSPANNSFPTQQQQQMMMMENNTAQQQQRAAVSVAPIKLFQGGAAGGTTTAAIANANTERPISRCGPMGL